MKKAIAIMGPTASGKTDISLKLALDIDTEIISVDSRQVYKYLDYGTGKVSKDDMKKVRHHMIDILEPEEKYSAHQFSINATQCAQKIETPMFVGGSFFWMRAVLYENALAEVAPKLETRDFWERKKIEEIVSHLKSLGVMEVGELNKRRLIRYIEIVEECGVLEKKEEIPRFNVLKISIDLDKEEIQENIKKRLTERFDNIVNEIDAVLKKNVSEHWLLSLGLEYRYITEYVQGKCSKQEAYENTLSAINKFAKRQKTWLKSEKDIISIPPTEYMKIVEEVKHFLR